MCENCTEIAASWAHKCGVFGAGNQTAAACAHFVHLPLQMGCVWRFHSQCVMCGLLTKQAIILHVLEGEGCAEDNSLSTLHC